MDTQMEKLLAAQERALQQKNEADRKAKQAKKQIEDLKRKRRTQRLIVRGAILEKFIPDVETLSDDDVSALLSGLLNKPDNQRWLKTWLEGHRAEEPIESVVVAGTFDEDEEPGWSEVPLDGTS